MITSIASVIVMLQMAVSLLSNPVVQASPSLLAQANSLANQAMTLSVQALSQNPDTQLGNVPTSSPVTSNVSSSGIAVNYTPPAQQMALGSATPTPVQNICTITGTVLPETSNMGFNFISFTWTVNGTPTTTPGQIYTSRGNNGPNFIWDSPINLDQNTRMATNKNFWKANIDGATCWAFLPNQGVGAQTISTPFSSFRGMNFN